MLGMTVDSCTGETLSANRLNGCFQHSRYNLCFDPLHLQSEHFLLPTPVVFPPPIVNNFFFVNTGTAEILPLSVPPPPPPPPHQPQSKLSSCTHTSMPAGTSAMESHGLQKGEDVRVNAPHTQNSLSYQSELQRAEEQTYFPQHLEANTTKLQKND